jgi:hypothetical protein
MQRALESPKFQALVKQEALVRLDFDWCNVPPSVNWRAISKVSEWLVEVRREYGLQMETLLLALHLLNCCLVAAMSLPPNIAANASLVSSMAQPDKMQAWACACLWVAAKRTEVTPLEAEDVVDVSDGVCRAGELSDLELYVLQLNAFRLDVPTAWSFRSIYHAHHQRHLAPYVLALADYLLLVALTWSSSLGTHHTRFPASTLALASIATACRLEAAERTPLDTSDLGACIALMLEKAATYGRQKNPGELYQRYAMSGHEAARFLRMLASTAAV